MEKLQQNKNSLEKNLMLAKEEVKQNAEGNPVYYM